MMMRRRRRRKRKKLMVSSENNLFCYPAALRRVQRRPKTNTNIMRYSRTSIIRTRRDLSKKSG